MKLGHPGHSRRLAVLGLASAIALGTSAIPATAASPPRIPDVAMTPPQPPFGPVPVPYPNISDIPITKNLDKASPILLSRGNPR
jgi:hypothetical protein